jgi:hypothetical protein
MDQGNGLVLSIYTLGTNMWVSKDNNSLKDTFGIMGVADMGKRVFHVEAPTGPLGLLIHMANNWLCVTDFKPNSVFSNKGIQVGNCLVAVDSVNVQHLMPKMLSQLVKERACATRLFTFERVVEEQLVDTNLGGVDNGNKGEDSNDGEDYDDYYHDYKEGANPNEICC